MMDEVEKAELNLYGALMDADIPVDLQRLISALIDAKVARALHGRSAAELEASGDAA